MLWVFVLRLKTTLAVIKPLGRKDDFKENVDGTTVMTQLMGL